MNVYAYDRDKFSDYIMSYGVDPEQYYISIISSVGPKGIPVINSQHDNVLTIAFDDVLESGEQWGNDIKAFYPAVAITEEQAQKLHDFIEAIPLNSNVHVHCVYGQSRTGAVAKYLQEYRDATVHNITLEKYNDRVFNLLKQTARPR